MGTIFALCDFSNRLLTGGFSPESERQVTRTRLSILADLKKCCDVTSPDSFSNLQLPFIFYWGLSTVLMARTTIGSTVTLHIQLFQFSGKFQEFVCLFAFLFSLAGMAKSTS